MGLLCTIDVNAINAPYSRSLCCCARRFVRRYFFFVRCEGFAPGPRRENDFQEPSVSDWNGQGLAIFLSKDFPFFIWRRFCLFVEQTNKQTPMLIAYASGACYAVKDRFMNFAWPLDVLKNKGRERGELHPKSWPFVRSSCPSPRLPGEYHSLAVWTLLLRSIFET